MARSGCVSAVHGVSHTLRTLATHLSLKQEQRLSTKAIYDDKNVLPTGSDISFVLPSPPFRREHKVGLAAAQNSSPILVLGIVYAAHLACIHTCTCVCVRPYVTKNLTHCKSSPL